MDDLEGGRLFEFELPRRHIFSVSELCREVRATLEGEFAFTWVRGEVSDLRRPPSGHLYFSLKDEEAQLRAVIFRQVSKYLDFEPEEGAEVLARGRLSVFSARGDLQFLVDYLEPMGAGALQVRFEQLKAKLLAEGLFDQTLKRPLPALPRRVGLITSPAGAALHDFVRVARRRWPNIDLLLWPSRMQGEGAAWEVSQGLRELGASGLVEVIVITRGGGSPEELSAFNSEELARAIRRCQVPVVSAVGHEVDVTIADFAADLRAPTPSAAAELVVPNKERHLKRLSQLEESLGATAARLLERLSRHHRGLAERLVSPKRRLETQGMRLAELTRLLQAEASELLVNKGWVLTRHAEILGHLSPARLWSRKAAATQGMFARLETAAGRQVAAGGERLTREVSRLEALSPLAVLGRGYAIARRLPEGKILRAASDAPPGRRVRVQLSRGELDCLVEESRG
jgi:exodeoxyribonuclease VII large subunit